MIETLVQGIVTEVLKGLNDKIDGLGSHIKALQTKNETLEKQNNSLMSRVASLEKTADQAEQYNRRNCLCISGYEEKIKRRKYGRHRDEHGSRYMYRL